MTDYNDGEWYGWNGGECPVHPESEGDVTYSDGERRHYPRTLGGASWEDSLMFRVTKPFVEPVKPREMWMDDDNILHDSLEDAKNMCHFGKPTRWVEVLE